jgi:hypothetical protein
MDIDNVVHHSACKIPSRQIVEHCVVETSKIPGSDRCCKQAEVFESVGMGSFGSDNCTFDWSGNVRSLELKLRARSQ